MSAVDMLGQLRQCCFGVCNARFPISPSQTKHALPLNFHTKSDSDQKNIIVNASDTVRYGKVSLTGRFETWCKVPVLSACLNKSAATACNSAV